LQRLEDRFHSPHAAFVAYTDDDAAGCVALDAQDRATAVVKRLYVRPAFRGLGIARNLLTSLIECARTREFDRLVLDTHRERLNAAYNLYLSFGFAQCSSYGTVEYACPTFMELPLR